MMSHSFNDRIVRLTEHLKPPACRVCLGRPSRVVMIDPVTNQETSESMPPSGCPACGTAIFRTYLVVADESRSS